MADITLVAKVTRTLLSLADLDINDHDKYVVGGPVLWVGSRRWKRETVDSSDVHGEVTVHKKLTNATDPLTVYVQGSTLSDLETNQQALIDAFSQDRYVLQLSVDGVDHQWDCEAADVDQVTYDNSHVAARYVAITFSITHQPVPLAGAL